MQHPYWVRSVLVIAFGVSLHTQVHADSAMIHSTNSTLQDAIVSSTNTGSVSSSANFNNAGIASGSYNVMSVSASGVAVSAMNSVQDTTPQANVANAQSVKGMSVTTNNSGAVAATANFQNVSLTGSHSGVSVQASGSSVSLSNIKQ